jgi:hypothetical protein
MAKTDTKALDPEVTRRLRVLAQRIVKDDFRGNKSAAAKAMEVSQSTLWDFIGEVKGAGGKVLLGLIKHAPVETLQIVSGMNDSRGDSLAQAKEAVDKLVVRKGIPRGEAWLLIEAVRVPRGAPSLEFYDAALLHHEKLLAREGSRLRTPAPPPEHGETLVIRNGRVGIEVPKKNEPQGPVHPRRRSPAKAHKL